MFTYTITKEIVDQEHLEDFNRHEEPTLHCLNCESPISDGTFCDNCKADLVASFKRMVAARYTPEEIEYLQERFNGEEFT